MKLLTHPATTALGLTSIYLLAITGQLVAAGHDVLYHWSGPIASLIVPIVIEFALLWLLLTLALLTARGSGRWSVAVWLGVALPLPWVMLKAWGVLAERYIDPWLFASLLGLTLTAFIVGLTGWQPRYTPLFERARRFVATVMGFVAITALFTLAQIGRLGWQARHLNASLPLHLHRIDAAQAGPRIIWVLFDELSYRQVYEHRYPGLQLPAFDRLAAESTVFTQTIPTGNKTEKVIPSLFTGRRADAIRVSADGRRLFLHESDSGAWTRFNPQQTVFADALNSGYSTAIAGWYNPYCRIMPSVLDQCFWAYNLPSLAGESPDRSVEGNVLSLLRKKLHGAISLYRQLERRPAFNAAEATLHTLDYTAISASADRLLRDRSAGFVFLHLPLPHPDGFYDRTTGQFATTHSTYLDNLALADRSLAHIRAVLEQNGDWDRSVVILMGDHSWRTYTWRYTATWTPEEQRATDGGRFDPRPVYLVKLPGQHTPARVTSPYAAIHTRALLDAVMDDSIHSPADLTAWAATWNAPTRPAATAAAE